MTTEKIARPSNNYFWRGIVGYRYAPIPPVPDNDELSAESQRLMFRHDHDGPSFFVAEKGTMYAGYVVGLIES